LTAIGEKKFPWSSGNAPAGDSLSKLFAHRLNNDAFGAAAVELVMFEFGRTNIGTRTFMTDYFKFFRAHGMRIERVTPSGYCHELSDYKNSLEQFRCTNLICYKA